MPQHHGRRSSTQLTLQAAFLQTALAVPPTAAGPIDVVDLFCGVGGFSEGARQAGHRVVLAVDSNNNALDAHKLNHPSAVHELANLPEDDIGRLLPSPDTKWHLHGSPPCTKLSRAGGTNRSASDRAEGLFLVNWFLDLVAEVGCTTWSMEQVAQEDVLEELAARQKAAPSLYAYHVVNMAHFGVPQERKRVIAGTPALVSRMQGRADPLRAPRVMDVIPGHPALAVGIKGRRATLGRGYYKQHAKAFQTPINKIPMELRMKRGGLSCPAPTVLASSPHRWVDATGKTIVTLSLKEHAALQSFPPEYQFSRLSKHALTEIGNAIPPRMAFELMTDWRG